MGFSTTVIIGFILSCTAFAIAWRYAKRIDNYSVVDAVWAFAFTVQVVLYASVSDGWLPRRLFIATMVALWSCRLGVFLARRLAKHHPQEDTRYQTLRKSYAPRISQRFFWFFQIQAWSVVLLSLLFLEVTRNPNAGFTNHEIIGFTVWLLALAGEGIADYQMSKFKSDPSNRGQVCEVGLWKYSRHPNYFFESCVWWGFYIFALGTPGTNYTVFAPLLILFLLLKVTGVKPSEAQSLKSRGEAYRDYQRRVSVFLPWKPKPLGKRITS